MEASVRNTLTKIIRQFKRGNLPKPTKGKPLVYDGIALPNLPLLDRAREWGISVKASRARYPSLGFCSHERKEIRLSSPDVKIWFHELAHAAHYRIRKLKTGCTPEKEIVAELAVIGFYRNVMKKTDKGLNTSLEFVAACAELMGMTPLDATISVLGDVDEVLSLILKRK